jgi:hypothetical protein
MGHLLLAVKQKFNRLQAAFLCIHSTPSSRYWSDRGKSEAKCTCSSQVWRTGNPGHPLGMSCRNPNLVVTWLRISVFWRGSHMPERGKRESPEPPDWWSLSLYSFVTEDLPLPAWVWEFMRRDRLREVLGGRPVDAMNPNPDLGFIEDSHYRNYYKPANHPYWDKIGKGPYYLPPAVNISGQWPLTFEGQQYRLEDVELSHWVTISIDINRRDTVIRKDFESILDLLRNEHPQPSGVLPKPTNWFDNKILQVWDLRQFHVSWSRIANLSGLSAPTLDTREAAIQKARNSFTTATNYIDDAGWKELARYFDK